MLKIKIITIMLAIITLVGFFVFHVWVTNLPVPEKTKQDYVLWYIIGNGYCWLIYVIILDKINK